MYVEECCTTKANVQPKGAKKIVNGYKAEQVILTLTASCPDEETGEPGKTTIKLETWMAPGVKIGSELDAFNETYARKLGLDIQMMMAVGDELRQAFPSLKDLAYMMKDLKGYPILSILLKYRDQKSRNLRPS